MSEVYVQLQSNRASSAAVGQVFITSVMPTNATRCVISTQAVFGQSAQIIAT